MSIVLKMNNDASDHTIQRSGFSHGMSSIPIYTSPEFGAGDPRDDRSCSSSSLSLSSSSSSSIGRNSDDSSGGGGGDGDGEEVESQFKASNGGLNNLEDLEDGLPGKKSISKFYAGKSRSFTSLADAASISSVKEIVKPEDAYTKKRKNLLAHNNFMGKGRNFLSSNANRGIYKRPLNSRSSSALAATMNCCSDSNYSSESLNSSPSSPRLALPPLPPQPQRCYHKSSLSPPEQKFSAWRSFSLSDLQGAAVAASAVTPSLMGIKE